MLTAVEHDVLSALANLGCKRPAAEKAVRKALPKGYGIDAGDRITRIMDEMDEPFLSAAGNNLLDFASDQEDEAVEQLIQILINHNSDERVRDQILDRFDRTHLQGSENR